MKKRFPIKLSMLFACLSLLLLSLGVNAQALTGIKTIPGDYSTISAAVAALNTNGVGTGGVTINVAAGHTETLTSTIVLTATGTQANPIVFQKSGAGANPQITAYVGGGDATSIVPDGMWAFVGSDYVTIDGINLLDPATNTTSVTTMEYGFGLFKASGINGSQHNTIQNCTVTLNRVNNTVWTFGHNGSIGITVFNSKYNAAGVQLVVSSASGSNSYNKFYSNTIQNCNAGMAFTGFSAPAPFILGDTLNDVGGSSLATGNNILNFGGAVGAANPATGIFAKDQWGMNVSYNTVNSNNGSGVKHPNVLRGIFLNASSNGASVTVKYNTVTIKGGGTSHQIEGINCAFGGGVGVNNIVDVSYNTLTGCSYTTATSGTLYLIFISGGVAKTTNVSNNIISEDSTNGTGSFAGIYCVSSPVGGTVNMNNNTINGMRVMAAGSGTYYGIYFTGAATNSIVNIRSNTFDNITQTGAQTGAYSLINTSGGLTNGAYDISNNSFNNLSTSTTSANVYLIFNTTTTCNVNIYNNSIVGGFTRTGASGTTYAYTNTATPTAGNSGVIKIYNNNFSNIVAGGSHVIYGINMAAASTAVAQIVRKNTIGNFSGGFTGLSYGINFNGTGRGSIVDSNTVSTVTAGGAFYGINVGSAVANNDVSIANNEVSGLSTSGASQLTGVNINNGTTFTGYVYNNKIYSLSATNAGGLVYGMNVGPATSINANNITVYNNRISGLTAPAAHLATGIPNQVVGINVPMTLGTLNVYNNTVQIAATSSGVNFGTSALSVNPGVTLDLRNNILVNTSTPNGTGNTAAFRRGAGALTTFAATSNSNILYAGDSTITGRHLYNENNTLIDTLMSAYKLRMGPGREDSTQTENVSFVSTTGTDPNYLKVNTGSFTFVESNASRIPMISFDANGNKRATFTGYNGTTGGLPDIGAVEGDYTGDLAKQMVFGFSNLIQDTGIVARGSVNNKIMRAVIVTQNTYNAMHATQFKFYTSGTTNDADIVAAKIYYTGADSVFSTASLFGSTANPTGAFYINGNQALAQDSNFFWLVYDVSATAAANNILDAYGDSVMIDGVFHDFLTANPVNNRTVKAPLSGNYNIGISGAYDYPRITDALTELYTLGVSGPVTFTLKDAAYTTATNEVFPLVLGNYAGRSAVNTVTIAPDAGVAAEIAPIGTFAGPAFRFDNAQYFIINGSQGAAGGFVANSNLIVKTSNTLYPTIELRNESSNNMIRYVDVRGRNTNLLSISQNTGSGIIAFLTTTGANGNDNNTVFGCAIHPDDVVLPTSAIYSWGTGTTDAMNNDGNIVDSCDIYDYFFSTNASAGVFVGLYNSTWQIINNRFFQTTTRVWTTGNNTHRAIWVNAMAASFSTSQSGFEVNNNQIGGNAPVMGGLYNLTPSGVAHFFTGIDVSVGWGTPSNIQGNTIANINVTTSQSSQLAINLINMNNGNVNCGTITGNIISNISDTTNAATGGGITGIRANNGGTYRIHNNTMSKITMAPNVPATNVGEFIGINVLGSTAFASIKNNLIGDTTLTGTNSINNSCTAPGSTFASRMYGILVNPNLNNPNMLVEGNYVANMNSKTYSTAAHLMKGIVIIPSANGIYNVNNNSVFNLTTASRSNGTGAGATLGGIIFDASVYNAVTISENTIHSLTLVDTAATAAVKAVGLYINSAITGDNIVSRNIIHSISKQSLNEAEVISGIEIGGGNPVVVNNLVRLGIDSAGVSMTTPSAIYGIVGTAGNSGVYHNTVYIGGTGVLATALAKRTFAYMRTNTSADDVRNNIFINQREPVTPNTGAGHFAVSLNSNTNLTQNYNILFADSVGVFNGTAYETANNWKVGSAVDANSLNSNPNLVNPIGDEFTLSLNIDTNLATAIEAYGQPLSAMGADVDFNGNSRSALTPVDLGAYAGNYMPLDLAAPVISYTPLQNTLLTGDRVVAATITDATGVYQTPLLAPRIYFKKSALGTYYNSTGIKTGGTAQNGTWTFTIDSAQLGGLMGDDSVYYFVVAQDSSSYFNLGSTPGGVEGSNVSSITVYPALNSYKIIALLQDTLEVGVGKTFTSLTGQGGAFSYIATSVLKGDLVLKITSDLEESGVYPLNDWNEIGAGDYSLHIVPDIDSLRSISGTFATTNSALIRLDGADRVKIDGSYNGSGRYLRLMNRAGTAGVVNFLNDADKDTLANCFIEGVVSNSLALGLVNLLNSTAVGATGNDSNVVMGCKFRDTLGSARISTPYGANKPNIGLMSSGSTTFANDYNQVIGNEFDNIRQNCINLTATSGDYWTLSNNEIYSSNDSLTTAFIHFSIAGGGGHMISYNSFGGSKIGRDSVPFTSYQGNTVRGIHYGSPSVISSYIEHNRFGNYYFLTVSGTFTPINMVSTSGVMLYVRYNIVGDTTNLGRDSISHNGSCYNYATQPVEFAYNEVANIIKRTANTTGYSAGISMAHSAGTANVHDNNIHDIYHAFTAASLGSQGPIGIFMLVSGAPTMIIERNTIANIGGINGGAIAKGINSNAPTTAGSMYINGNRISNIFVTHTIPATGAMAIGIYSVNNPPPTHMISNNYISLGSGNSSTGRLIGYGSGASGVQGYNFYNNSIFINGTGDSSSYGIYALNTAPIYAQNNLIYNKRISTGADQHVAIGNQFGTVASMMPQMQHNMLITNDTAKLVEGVSLSMYGWTGIDSMYGATYNKNWASTAALIPADSLFTDTLTNDLSIVTTNSHAWYVNGKGMPFTTVSGDNGTPTGVRSTTIATGATDIGADEFTPSSTPPMAHADKTPAAGDSTLFYFASRKVAQLNWDFVGNLPSLVNAYYYSGVEAPNQLPGRTATNAYWDFQTIDGTGYAATVTLMQDSANFGDIVNPSNLNVAHYDGAQWTKDSFTVVNNAKGFFTSGQNMFGMGIFTGTDGTNNPLPVRMTTFTAKVNNGDVIVDWKTASEMNNRGFEIERSLDGRSFETVGFVKGAGNSNTVLSYMYNDKAAFAKTSAQVLYYRLKQVDMNGAFNYSNIARVSMNNKEVNAVSTYPNPFTTEMQVSFNATAEGKALVRILNIQGMTVAEQTATATKGMNRLDIESLTSLPKGMYFVELTVNSETTVIKVVKN